VRTALKGKRFQDVEGIMKNVTAELGRLLTVFRNSLNDKTNLFKSALLCVEINPFVHITKRSIKRRGRIGRIPASCPGGPGLKSRQESSLFYVMANTDNFSECLKGRTIWPVKNSVC
jgi:hypothetical protein